MYNGVKALIEAEKKLTLNIPTKEVVDKNIEKPKGAVAEVLCGNHLKKPE